MDGTEADDDLVLIQTFLHYYVNQVIKKRKYLQQKETWLIFENEAARILKIRQELFFLKPLC